MSVARGPRLTPPWDEVYAWWQNRDNRDTWYCAVENYWFRSLSGSNCSYRTFLDDLVFKPDVDRDAALRHVRHVLGSCVKHEWKIGAAAMLLQEWCERPDFDRYLALALAKFGVVP